MNDALTQIEAAELAGVTPRRMRQLDHEADPPPRNTSGLYPRDDLLTWLDRRQAERKAHQKMTAQHRHDLARLYHHKAELVRLQVAVMKGEMIKLDDVLQLITDKVMPCKAKLLAIPSKTAPHIWAAGSLEEKEQILIDAIEDALAELDGDPVPIRDAQG